MSGRGSVAQEDSCDGSPWAGPAKATPIMGSQEAQRIHMRYAGGSFLFLVLLSTQACNGSSSSDAVETHDRGAFLDMPGCSLIAGPPSAQDEVHPRGKTAECRIALLVSNVSLASDPAGSVPDPAYPIVLNSRGEFLTATVSPGEIALWRPDGEFSRLISRQGEGPGEIMGRPQFLMDRWDSLHVRHAGGFRWSVFDPDFAYARIVQGRIGISNHKQTVFCPDGSAITSTAYLGVPRSRYLFEVVSRSTGEVVGGFGNPGPEETLPRRLMALGSDTSFWAMPTHRYRAEEWACSGELLRIVECENDWFLREDDSIWDPTKEADLQAEVRDFYFDGTLGLLWVLVLLPDPEAPPFEPSPLGYSQSQFGNLFDLILEVIDVRNSRVLASQRAEGRHETISGFLPDGRAFRRVEDRFGLRSYQVLELRLVDLPL